MIQSIRPLLISWCGPTPFFGFLAEHIGYSLTPSSSFSQASRMHNIRLLESISTMLALTVPTPSDFKGN